MSYATFFTIDEVLPPPISEEELIKNGYNVELVSKASKADLEALHELSCILIHEAHREIKSIHKKLLIQLIYNYAKYTNSRSATGRPERLNNLPYSLFVLQYFLLFPERAYSDLKRQQRIFFIAIFSRVSGITAINKLNRALNFVESRNANSQTGEIHSDNRALIRSIINDKSCQ